MKHGALQVLVGRIMSKAAFERTWEAFMDGGTNHSARATTLPQIINHCEDRKIPYRLTAYPGLGYFIEPWKEAPPITLD